MHQRQVTQVTNLFPKQQYTYAYRSKMTQITQWYNYGKQDVGLRRRQHLQNIHCDDYSICSNTLQLNITRLWKIQMVLTS